MAYTHLNLAQMILILLCLSTVAVVHSQKTIESKEDHNCRGSSYYFYGKMR